MKSHFCLVVILLMHLPLLALADSLDVEDCKRIENESRRLNCYDELFQRAAGDKAENTGTKSTEPESSELSSEPQAEAAAISEFGAEQIAMPPLTSVEARLVGDFNGWTGKTVFTLDNGQVWRQTNNYIRDYTPRDPIPAPKVTISKGMLGSYNLHVEGVKRIVQVKRVK